MEKDDELILYFVVNKDLNMSGPKISIQTAHVASIITYKQKGEEIFEEWYNNGISKKVALGAHEKYLLKLVNQGFVYIKDLGFTEVPPNSLTCVGIGPMKRSEAKKYVKRLQKLKDKDLELKVE